MESHLHGLRYGKRSLKTSVSVILKEVRAQVAHLSFSMTLGTFFMYIPTCCTRYVDGLVKIIMRLSSYVLAQFRLRDCLKSSTSQGLHTRLSIEHRTGPLHNNIYVICGHTISTNSRFPFRGGGYTEK